MLRAEALLARSESPGAVETLKSAAEVLRGAAEPEALARVLDNLGALYVSQEDHVAAAATFDELKTIFESPQRPLTDRLRFVSRSRRPSFGLATGATASRN